MAVAAAQPETPRKPTRAQIRAAQGIIERHKRKVGPKPSPYVKYLASLEETRAGPSPIRPGPS